jgi:hypothetical protein
MGTGLKAAGITGTESCRALGGRIRARALALGHGSQDPHHLLLSGLAGALDEALVHDLAEGHPSPALEVLLGLLQNRNRDAQLSQDLEGLATRLHGFEAERGLLTAS